MTDYRIAALCETREARELLALLPTEAAAERPRAIAASGLPAPLLSLLVREGCRRLAPDRLSVVFVGDAAAASRLADELQADGLRAAAYLPREYVLYHVSASHDAERSRLAVLSALLDHRLDVVVTTPAAALGYTVPRERLRARTLTIRVGDTLSPEALCRVLADCGFLSVGAVEGAGQFAHRGGIVDFSADGDAPPVRVEFFGDEVDRIGHFDPLTQRLTEPLDEAAVFPAREVIPDAEARERAAREQASANAWTCGCGATNSGKFCSECGAKKPEAAAGWTCKCGATNYGKFCSECGSARPAGEWFCTECGTKNDAQSKFCSECGTKKA